MGIVRPEGHDTPDIVRTTQVNRSALTQRSHHVEPEGVACSIAPPGDQIAQDTKSRCLRGLESSLPAADGES